MSKKYQIFLTCGFVATEANVFAETNYAECLRYLSIVLKKGSVVVS